MSPIKGIHFKVDVLGSPSPAPAPKADTADIDAAFDTSLLEDTGTDTTTPPGADYTFGELDGAGDSSSGSDIETFLRNEKGNCPPIYSELIAEKEQLADLPDLFQAKYDAFQEDLETFLNNVNESLNSGNLTAGETIKLNRIRGLVEDAIARTKQQKEELAAFLEKRQEVYQNELNEGIDLDGNGWVGQPYEDGSLKCVQDSKGDWVLVDPTTRQVVSTYIADGKYQAGLADATYMKMIAAKDVYGNPANEADLNLEIQAEALRATDPFSVGLGIPEYIWVERDSQSTQSNKAKLTYSQSGLARKMTTAAFGTYAANGKQMIGQDVPADKSNYVQVRVAKVELNDNDESIGSLEGNQNAKLYNHCVNFYDSQNNLIMKVRITGPKVTPEIADCPAVTKLNNGDSVIAASTVKFSLHGQNRASSVIVDADNGKFTGRSKMDTSLLGIQKPEDPIGARAYDDITSLFSGDSITSWNYNPDKAGGAGWEQEVKTTIDYKGYTDAYISPDLKMEEGDTFQTYNTGIFVKDLRGEIKGSKANDCIDSWGISDMLSDPYVKEHMPEKYKKLTLADEVAKNFIDGGGGTNMAIFGSGNNYIQGAAFVWGKNGSGDENYIKLPGQSKTNPKDAKPPESIKNFVHIEGGLSNIVNPNEKIPGSEPKDVQSASDVTKWEPQWSEDDYYNVSGNAKYSWKDDPNLAKCTSGNMGEDGLVDLEFGTFWDAEKKEWDTDFRKVAELDFDVSTVDWDSEEYSYDTMSAEMDDFFNSVFGEFNQDWTEINFKQNE